MAQHKLSLIALETMNVSSMKLIDTSIYAEGINVKCPLMEITLPGFNYAVQFGEDRIQPEFNAVFTACHLEIQTENCGTQFSPLPDGIYVLKYSVSPNDLVFVEYNHLRITKALTQYSKVLCGIDLAGCEPDSETSKKIEELRKIKMYLEAAKAKVEVCHQPGKGMELYNYAMKLLGKFECSSCY